MWVGWYVLIFVIAAGALVLAIRGLPAAAAKERLDIISTIVTTAAVLVGAVWVWDEFSRERQGVPRLTAAQTITSLPIPEDQTLLDVQTMITNAGKTRVTLEGGFTRIQQVLPLDKRLTRAINPTQARAENDGPPKTEPLDKSGVILWPTLCRHPWDKPIVLEPGENHPVNEQFLVPRQADVVRVYTYVVSPEDSSIGYEVSTLHAVTKPGGASNETTRVSSSSVYRNLCSYGVPTSDSAQKPPSSAVPN